MSKVIRMEEKQKEKIEEKLSDKAKKFISGCKDSGGTVDVNGNIITCKIKTAEMEEPVDLVTIKDESKSHTLMEKE